LAQSRPSQKGLGTEDAASDPESTGSGEIGAVGSNFSTHEKAQHHGGVRRLQIIIFGALQINNDCLVKPLPIIHIASLRPFGDTPSDYRGAPCRVPSSRTVGCPVV